MTTTKKSRRVTLQTTPDDDEDLVGPGSHLVKSPKHIEVPVQRFKDLLSDRGLNITMLRVVTNSRHEILTRLAVTWAVTCTGRLLGGATRQEASSTFQ